MDESRHEKAVTTLTGMKGCSGSGTSNGISVSVKSELSSMSIEPSSMAYRNHSGSCTKVLTQLQLDMYSMDPRVPKQAGAHLAEVQKPVEEHKGHVLPANCLQWEGS